MEGLQTALAMRRAACRPPRPLGERLRRHLLGTTAPYGLHNKWPRIFSWRGISQRYLARLRERHLFLIVRKLRRPFDLPEPQERRPRTSRSPAWGMHSSAFSIASEFNELPRRALDRLIFQRLDAFDVSRGATPLQTGRH